MIAATIDDRRLQFNFDGTVLSLDDGKKGRWTTEATATTEPNSIGFTLPDQSRSQVCVDFGFNATNQLSVGIPVQPGVAVAVAPVEVPGQLFADDPQDLQYAVLASDGTLTSFRFFVYGDLRLEQRTDQLILKLKGSGRDIVVQGERAGANCLTADAFQQPGQDTLDRLRFGARTRNRIGSTTYVRPADIHFVGRWSFVGGQLVFAARVTVSGGLTNAVVALAGTYKATNFGLLFKSTAAGKEFTFTVASRFQVSGITGEWELQLGHSSQARFASGSFTARTRLSVGRGGQLAIQGTVKFGTAATAGAGDPLALEVDLQANYTFSNGHLVFSVKAGPSGYSLYFGGQFRVGQNGTVTFALNYGPDGPAGRIAVEIGDKDDQKVKAGLELILSRSGRTLNLDLGASFRVTWANGTMIAA